MKVIEHVRRLITTFHKSVFDLTRKQVYVLIDVLSKYLKLIRRYFFPAKVSSKLILAIRPIVGSSNKRVPSTSAKIWA